MAYPVQVGGHAVVFGMPNFVSAKGTIADPGTAVSVYITEVSHEHQTDSEETRDKDGAVVNMTMYNHREQLTVTCYPYSTTTALAKGANELPEIGMSFGLTGEADNDKDIAIAAETVYMVTAASKTRSQTGKAVWNLTLVKWDGITSYAQLS